MFSINLTERDGRLIIELPNGTKIESDSLSDGLHDLEKRISDLAFDGEVSESLKVAMFADEGYLKGWEEQVAYDRKVERITSLMESRFPMFPRDALSPMTIAPGHDYPYPDTDNHAKQKPIYDAWERLEERAYDALEKNGSKDPNWVLFLDEVAGPYGDGWKRREKFEEYGFFPEGYQDIVKEWSRHKASDPDWQGVGYVPQLTKAIEQEVEL